MMSQNQFHDLEGVKAEFTFLSDILKHIKCPQSFKDNVESPNYENGYRMKRGVMENIVSAYSDIFTKGYEKSFCTLCKRSNKLFCVKSFSCRSQQYFLFSVQASRLSSCPQTKNANRSIKCHLLHILRS